MDSAPVVAYRVAAWQLGKDGGARWTELGITPINSFDAFNLKPGCEYYFKVTPRNRYGWGEAVQTSNPVLVGVPLQMPEFTKLLPGQMKALTGKTLSLNCVVKGHPKPIVLWYKNGLELLPSDRVTMSNNGSVCCLSFLNVNDTDMGRYTCEATNKEGRVSTFVRLLVVDDPKICEADLRLKELLDGDRGVGECQPQFMMRLRDRRVQVTYPVRLTCQCIGDPQPEIKWYKDNKEIELNGKQICYLDLKHTMLSIHQLSI